MSRAPFSYRGDPAVPAFPDDRPIIIFDGKCVLCSTFARFVLWADRLRRFRMMPAQTPIGTALYRHYDLESSSYETYVLLADGRAWLKSEASIRILELLGFPWRLMAVIRLLPRAPRDWVYDVVARNRLRWFGARATSYLPDATQSDRFLG